MLGFTSFYVRGLPRAATFWWVYLRVYPIFDLGVFSNGRLEHSGAYRHGD
jgi:hypothetical protein